ncbi:peptidoglycan DD-metalloendopeptidase family protein [Flavivirga abyssicola]|uniref:peptidoglycan DD-metalloendopeptidase family protein n=1 Tax=Flavivirga abyssicola TaxID=3063533 RepID=UPI0026DECC3B|nr:peptidoglycan DD-metalloendopeptidase family protein [Flavivirga sp. MEBiC07777]WVK13662.1 peptidoglycan DD-metalloendopeptidase family protein [Flavivirga sp. MEBiC07777]
MILKDFSYFLSSISNEPLRVLDASIPNTKYISLDLSESNETLNSIDVSSSSKLNEYVNNHIKKHNALVAYGGYLEVRNIYKRSSHFNKQAEDGRNIHLGIDLWCLANTPIYAPLDATVHSFKNNTNYGDYGPTIILKHTINKVVFYTLYGHLSLASIKDLKVDQTFKQGEQIAILGDFAVNGDYPPHLHFQIIKDIQNHMGDYPGVCSKKDLEFYIENCPDPNTLMKHV